MDNPPETLMVWPVMYPLAGSKNMLTTCGKSVGCANRFIGTERSRAGASLPPLEASKEASSGVSVGPGHTELKVMPCRANSLPRVFISAIVPPLAAEYTASPEDPTRPASEAMLTIRPTPCFAISREAIWVMFKGP